ncbi:hypothetical protein L484_015329 [Morus notabilis]|uniref:Uncharacterized protein n=1 Tax=Morus notabilis TaxID=981085 RepID=W9S0Z0_9ROSA|nr:hypothetical protein L484_015329 [Morus notabilis]
MADHHDQQLVQKRDVIQKNPLEAPPEYSTELPDLSVLRLSSPCTKCGFSGTGNGNSHKRQRPFFLMTLPPPPPLTLSSAVASPSTFLLRLNPSGILSGRGLGCFVERLAQVRAESRIRHTLLGQRLCAAYRQQCSASTAAAAPALL